MSDWWNYPTDFNNTITGNSSDSVTGVGSLFGTYPASTVSGYGVGIVCIMWLVFYSLSIASGVRKAMMTSSFVTGVLSVFLWRIGIVDTWILFVLIALTIVGAIGSKEEQL